MLSFTYPWLFILSIVPFFIYYLLPAYRTKQVAIYVPFFDVLVNAMGLPATKGAKQLTASRWQKVLLIVGWLLLVVAMAKPVWLGEPVSKELYGRDLMVAVDLSGSMAERDFVNSKGEQVSRLAATKEVLKQFSQERKGDRLGLILFADSAFIQAPFTADHEAWNELLNEAKIGMAGKSTHLGDAIGLGVKSFISETDQATNKQEVERVMIVLTDGNDTDSLVPPVEAAKVAALYQIRIYMIAIGDPTTQGENALDIESIKALAEITGGKAFFALSPSELESIYRHISEHEVALYESFSFQPELEVHYVPVIILLLNYLVMFLFYSLKKLFVSTQTKGGNTNGTP